MKISKNVVIGALVLSGALAIAAPASADYRRGNYRNDRRELYQDRLELMRDRRELQRDLHNGASRGEIAQDRREIRQDLGEIWQDRRELRYDRWDYRPYYWHWWW